MLNPLVALFVVGGSNFSMKSEDKKELPRGGGSYILLIKLSKGGEILIGKMGSRYFSEGSYLYLGSAMKGLKSRIDRHLRDNKRLHWHIDYLLVNASVEGVITIENGNKLECELARGFKKVLKEVTGFGASDCKCTSHLYFAKKGDDLKAKIKEELGGPKYRYLLKDIRENSY